MGGAPYELGFAQGAALRIQIQGLRDRLRDLEAFRFAQPHWLPYRVYLALAEWKAKHMLVPALQRFAPAMLARLKGVAAGAGATVRSLALLNALEALLSQVAGRITVAPFGACSALAIRGSRSRTGEPVLARNFDYLPLAQPFYTLRESRPRDGWRSLDFVVAPQAGTIDGLNEKGLCLTLNYAFMTDPARPAPLITMAIADALAHCASVQEAADRIARQPRWGAGIIMLVDAAGDLAALELSNTRSALRRPATGKDWLALTNVCHCPETRAIQVPATATFSERVPQPLRGQPVLRWHSDRASRIEHLLGELGALGNDDLAAIMSDHGPTGIPDGSSPCVHTNYWRTTAALQWFPRRRTVRAWYGTACEARYVEIAL